MAGRIGEILEMEKDYIISAYLDGKSTCELGRELGVSNASVFLFLRDKCNIEMRKTNNKFADREDEMVKLYNDGLSIDKIAKQLDIPSSSVNRYLKKLDKDTSRFRTNPEIAIRSHTEEILKMYEEGIGCSLIAKKFNTYDTTILNILHENGVEIRGPRQKSLNESYFEKIDSEAKAYILGWLYADGYNGGQAASITIIDKEIVEMIRQELEYDVPISEIKGIKDHHKLRYKLKISSVKICQDLTNLGCFRKKSLTVLFPTFEQVPKYLMSHFIRGVLDGDGTITSSLNKYNKRRYYFSIVSSHDFCDYLRDFIVAELGHHYGVVRTGKVSKVQSGGYPAVKAFLDYIYKDATFKLDRKYQKYLEFLKSENQG